MKKTSKQQQNQVEMNSEVNSMESSPDTTPSHQVKSEFLTSNVANSFNNLDMHSSSNRNLSEKELRDCDVIG